MRSEEGQPGVEGDIADKETGRGGRTPIAVATSSATTIAVARVVIALAAGRASAVSPWAVAPTPAPVPRHPRKQA